MIVSAHIDICDTATYKDVLRMDEIRIDPAIIYSCRIAPGVAIVKAYCFY